jgi:hypothetical protein
VTQKRIIIIIAGSEIKYRFMCTGKRGWMIKINAKRRHQESGHESTFQPQNPHSKDATEFYNDTKCAGIASTPQP